MKFLSAMDPMRSEIKVSLLPKDGATYRWLEDDRR